MDPTHPEVCNGVLSYWHNPEVRTQGRCQRVQPMIYMGEMRESNNTISLFAPQENHKTTKSRQINLMLILSNNIFKMGVVFSLRL